MQTMLSIFDSFTFDESDQRPCFLFTMDVKSLYTVIPNNGGLQAVNYFLDQRTVKESSTHTLVRLAELVLTLNAFSFDDQHYCQIGGVAMGTTAKLVELPWAVEWGPIRHVCYTCQLSRIMREFHACGCEIVTSCVQTNFSLLTDNSECNCLKTDLLKFSCFLMFEKSSEHLRNSLIML